jgi:hypothetical protein
MSRKIISTFTAAAMSMSIALAVPVAVTAVSSLTIVPEAQAWGLKNIKKAAKKTTRLVKKEAKNAKSVLSDGSVWKDMPGATKEAYGIIGKGAYKYAKLGLKKNVFSATGAAKLAYSDIKRGGRNIDRRLSKTCVALGSCQGTITRR